MLVDPVYPSHASHASSAAQGKRGRPSNRYAVELDGKQCGWLTDLAGAAVMGELGSNAGRFEELTIRCWPAMPRGFFQWVLRSFAPEPTGSDGLLVLADDSDRELSRLRWTDGVVTEFATTAIDASSPDNAKLALKFTPRLSQRGEVLGPEVSPAAADTRRPLPAPMPELQIDGLEEVCCHIKRIEGLVIRQRIRRTQGDSGMGIVCEREAPGIYMSPLVLTLPESKGQGFRRWLEACEAGKSNGRTATLMLGAPSVGFTVALQGVRPVRIDDTPGMDRDDPRRRDLRVELRARDVVFALAPGK
ncbi:MAG TPA: hypothetical protein VGB85_25905 [Nannocystis sp.]